MRVVVADDSLLTREGIVRLLRDAGIDVVAEAGDAEALLGHVRSARPEVAIVDIRMPSTHTDEGLVAAWRITCMEYPDVGALLLSQCVEPSYAMRADPGPTGSRRIPPPGSCVQDIAVVVDALRRTADGDTVIDPTIVSSTRRVPTPLRPSGALVGAGARGPRADSAEGMSNKAITARLYVTQRTVEAHVTRPSRNSSSRGRPTSIAVSSRSSRSSAHRRSQGADREPGGRPPHLRVVLMGTASCDIAVRCRRSCRSGRVSRVRPSWARRRSTRRVVRPPRGRRR